MNQLTRRAILGVAVVGAGLVGKTKVGGQSTTPPVDSTTGPTAATSSTPTPPVPEAPVDFIAWTNSSGFSSAGGDSGEPLVTPHFNLAITGFAVLSELSEVDVAELEGNVEPMKAPEGYQFVALSLEADEPIGGDDPRATLGVSVNGKVVNRATPFGSVVGGRYSNPQLGVIVVAKTSDEVFLHLTDVGQTARYDIRAGKRATDASTKLFEGFIDPPRVAVDKASGSWSRPFRTNQANVVPEGDTFLLDVDLEFDGFLYPWTKAQGFAPAGQLWLVGQVTPRYKFSSRPQRPLNPAAVIDIPKSYTLTPTGGKAALAKTSMGRVNARDFLVNYDKLITAVWTVPATAKGAVLKVDFNVPTLIVPYVNGNVTAAFTGPSKFPQFALTFG